MPLTPWEELMRGVPKSQEANPAQAQALSPSEEIAMLEAEAAEKDGVCVTCRRAFKEPERGAPF